MGNVMGKVMAVCISESKGTAKQNVGRALCRKNHGFVGDAHAGNWHRQVSLLSFERVEEFKSRGAMVGPGDFGENLLVAGIEFKALAVGTRLRCKQVELELTQIGKQCHQGCRIFQAVGDCIMPRDGVFARVLQGGEIEVGDSLQVIAEEERG